jgi:pimeloyl-ACP methyl ester carboxylesterase
MHTLLAPDGTRLAYQRLGAGPPLVLVPGTGAANPIAWTGVAPALAERCTLLALDRRGHGQSGDREPYALEREVEDVAALVQAAGQPAHLLGHSFGALLALEAARFAPALRGLILYEPGFPLPGHPLYPPGLLARLQALLAAGEREAVVTTYYRESAGLSVDEIEALRQSPAWPARLATAHTLPREMLAEAAYSFDARDFQQLKTPTLLVSGSDSPPFLKAATQALTAALPNARLAVLPGQQHIAMYTAPDLFAQTLLAFLSEQ